MATRDADDVASAKKTLRARLLARRADRPTEEVVSAGDALARNVFEVPEVAAARTVCCYVSTGGEPATGPLLERLLAHGVRVLLPVLRPDFDLDWGTYAPGGLVAGRFGLWEPGGAKVGVAAVAEANAVICPGLAVDGAGRRLGRGGGSYDRALSRTSDRTRRLLLLYDDEVLDVVPAGPHDQLVDVAVTPTRVLALRHPHP